MERYSTRSRRGIDSSASSSVTWVIPKHYLAIPEVKNGVDAVAGALADKGFTGPEIKTVEAKSVITFYSPTRPGFKDALYLATLLPLQLDEPVEMWFALQWTGAKDAEDGKFDCKVKYRLEQWMLKICYETEVEIGEIVALEKKKWLIRL